MVDELGIILRRGSGGDGRHNQVGIEVADFLGPGAKLAESLGINGPGSDLDFGFGEMLTECGSHQLVIRRHGDEMNRLTGFQLY